MQFSCYFSPGEEQSKKLDRQHDDRRNRTESMISTPSTGTNIAKQSNYPSPPNGNTRNVYPHHIIPSLKHPPPVPNKLFRAPNPPRTSVSRRDGFKLCFHNCSSHSARKGVDVVERECARVDEQHQVIGLADMCDVSVRHQLRERCAMGQSLLALVKDLVIYIYKAQI